jgi:hypothetical protein
MPKTGREKTVKLLWLWGNFVWCSIVALLWWHGHESQTFAQASPNSTRIYSFQVLAPSGRLLAGCGWRNSERPGRSNHGFSAVPASNFKGRYGLRAIA